MAFEFKVAVEGVGYSEVPVVGITDLFLKDLQLRGVARQTPDCRWCMVEART